MAASTGSPISGAFRSRSPGVCAQTFVDWLLCSVFVVRKIIYIASVEVQRQRARASTPRR
eukprot:16160850-Heterocapsa_arctica.AAC.1